LVVAIKRAVGSEYQYTGATYLPKEKLSKQTRAKKQISPSYKVALGVFFIAIVFCGGLSYLTIKAATAKINYDVSNLKRSNQEIVIGNEKLKLEIEKLKSLDRIETLASTNLGMIRSANIEYLVMSGRENPAAKTASPGTTVAAVAATDKNTALLHTEAQISSGEKFLQKIEMLIFNKG